MDTQYLQAGPHHQRIRFTNIIGFFAGSNFDWCDKRTAGWDNTCFRRTGEIRICADQSGTVHYMVHSAADMFIIVVIGFTNDYIIWVNVVKSDINIMQSIEEAGTTDHVGAAARCLMV
ncbi:hypothetical protein SDC9_116313 [bioreactor metagenome]|uniref:Uncharacterized protein n=1 Tax=bioreactor metagenome TaxID=1076179 RepID=A0A645BW90_9ZZZZ